MKREAALNDDRRHAGAKWYDLPIVSPISDVGYNAITVHMSLPPSRLGQRRKATLAICIAELCLPEAKRDRACRSVTAIHAGAFAFLVLYQRAGQEIDGRSM